MKTAIQKFRLEFVSTQQVQICSLEYLCVGLQDDKLFLWAWVNPNEAGTMKVFHVVPTGGEPKLWSRHLGMVVQQDGAEWHVFEGVEQW